MAVKFFMLQCHYRSTLDLTDDALQSAEKGYRRLMDAFKKLKKLESTSPSGSLDTEINALLDGVYADMNDDFSTPKALGTIFELVTKINILSESGTEGQLSTDALARLKQVINTIITDVFGLLDETEGDSQGTAVNGLMELILDLRQAARVNKDWPTSDKIRDGLAAIKIQVKDGKEGSSWSFQ
ncbi:MAG TPA: cysteine--tRNA ligase, partial [Saprospiraceae bacterium]|nr:cysteine--tRNA ligase [Saprospiraceae bacterium]